MKHKSFDLMMSNKHLVLPEEIADYCIFQTENGGNELSRKIEDLINKCITDSKQAENKQLVKHDVSGCYIERICDSCNTAYLPELSYLSDNTQATATFQNCPNCGERDDVWVKVHINNNH